MIQNRWLRWLYKSLAVLLLTYALVYGLSCTLPQLSDLQQTSRNLFYHVPMWFTMYLMMGMALVWSLMYLRTGNPRYDENAREASVVGVFFGCLGLVTGMVWSRVTWGQLLPATDPTAWWAWDPKQTLALAAVLIYAAYFLLRSSVEEPRQRARLASAYNVFAAAGLVPLTLIIPRMVESMHPGGKGDGSPVFNQADISDEFRLVFYPAILGFMFLALWLVELRIRLVRLQQAADTQATSSQPIRKGASISLETGA